jgi:hypothetical protein
MPETIKLNKHWGDPSAMPEPNPGAKEISPVAAEPQSSRKDEATPQIEDHSDSLPDMPDHESIGDFADSVVFGLEQAGFEIEAEANSEPDHPDEAGAELPENSEAFFAGWDGPEEDGTDESAAQPEPDPRGHRTLSEIGLASASILAAEYTGAVDVATRKHDELADAVQSALLSVYGDASGHSDSSGREEIGVSEELDGSDSGWNGFSGGQPAAAGEDRLSPQDVILNYFSYDSNAQDIKGRPSGGYTSASEYEDETAEKSPQHQNQSAQGYYPAQRQSQWAEVSSQAMPYPLKSGFPVPAVQGVAKTAAASERESSRLLGAAAIGLVGGIAIAATLAVFLINSYGPDIRVSPGEYRNSEASEPGYGYAVRESGEAQRSAAVSSPAEVVASDAVATSGQPSPLAIGIRTQRPSEQTLVSITGIPEGGRLNAGVDAGGGNWLLPPRRLSGLTINLPRGVPNPVPLEVQLLDSNARTPLSEKRQFVIRMNSVATEANAPATSAESMVPSAAAMPQSSGSAQFPASVATSFDTRTVRGPSTPASEPAAPQRAAPDSGFKTQTVAAPATQRETALPFQASLGPANTSSAQPASAPQEGVARRASLQPEIEDLIREGNKHMREGDILEARQLYQKAVLLGDPEAALAMGRSYDPIYFARIEKKNAEPDAAKAFDWYRKAMDGGAAQTAKVRIENLKHFLNE